MTFDIHVQTLSFVTLDIGHWTWDMDMDMGHGTLAMAHTLRTAQLCKAPTRLQGHARCQAADTPPGPSQTCSSADPRCPLCQIFQFICRESEDAGSTVSQFLLPLSSFAVRKSRAQRWRVMGRVGCRLARQDARTLKLPDEQS